MKGSIYNVSTPLTLTLPMLSMPIRHLVRLLFLRLDTVHRYNVIIDPAELFISTISCVPKILLNVVNNAMNQINDLCILYNNCRLQRCRT